MVAHKIIYQPNNNFKGIKHDINYDIIDDDESELTLQKTKKEE